MHTPVWRSLTAIQHYEARNGSHYRHLYPSCHFPHFPSIQSMWDGIYFINCTLQMSFKMGISSPEPLTCQVIKSSSLSWHLKRVALIQFSPHSNWPAPSLAELSLLKNNKNWPWHFFHTKLNLLPIA